MGVHHLRHRHRCRGLRRHRQRRRVRRARAQVAATGAAAATSAAAATIADVVRPRRRGWGVRARFGVQCRFTGGPAVASDHQRSSKHSEYGDKRSATVHYSG